MKTKNLKSLKKFFINFILLLFLNSQSVMYRKKSGAKKKKAMTFTKSHYLAHLKGNPSQVKVKKNLKK
jgi:hypothetical protein